MTITIPERGFIEVLGLRTAYYRKGEGPTVVLMHGSSPGACTELNWFRNFDALADAGFDVVGFDQAGFGYTDAPEDHGIEFRYRHAKAFLEQMGIRRAVLAGNSMGGLLAVLLHDRRDEHAIDVAGLVLAAQFPHFEIPADIRTRMQQHMSRLSAVEPTPESVRTLTMNTLANHANLTPQLLQFRLAMLDRTYEPHKARGKAGTAFDAQQVRSRPVDAPALVVWGIQDHSLPVEIGIEAMKHFSAAEFVFLPQCGHWPQTEHADHFNLLTADFVRRVNA
jgi:2-hydroxy-6-oxonona-2,4-dienedioate hydrolase